MIRLYVEDAKKEKFRIESDEPITIISGLSDAGRPIYIFEGVRDDVSMENAEESGFVIKYNPMEPHRFPNDTNLVVNADKHGSVQIVAEEKEPDPEIVTPTIPATIDEAVHAKKPAVEVDLTAKPEVQPVRHVVEVTATDDVSDDEDLPPVVGAPVQDITPEVARSISQGDLPLPSDVVVPTTPPPPIRPKTPIPPSRPRRPVPPTRRPGGGSERNPQVPPQS